MQKATFFYRSKQSVNKNIKYSVAKWCRDIIERKPNIVELYIYLILITSTNFYVILRHDTIYPWRITTIFTNISLYLLLILNAQLVCILDLNVPSCIKRRKTIMRYKYQFKQKNCLSLMVNNQQEEMKVKTSKETNFLFRMLLFKWMLLCE